MGIFDGFLTQLGTGDQIKDFKHASQLFVGDNFRLAPKHGYLYHVFFDLDVSLTRIGKEPQIEAGMLVKSVDLPKFTLDVKTMNSYNKPNLVQNKIKYENLNISFHDDNADVVRNLWFDYYHYYYRDTDLGYADKSGTPNPTYFASTKYGNREKNNYGYNPRNYSMATNGAIPQYIKAIRIYSLHQKRFSEYTLINPFITSFRHGQHQAGSGELMGHEMTIAYEFVLYASGTVNKNTVKGFADIHYDTSPSPLTPAGGGTKSLLGPGGLIDTADEVITDLSKDPPDYGAAAFKAFRGFQNLKNMNVKKAASAELGQIGTDLLRGNNPLNRIAIPSLGGLATTGIATAYGARAGTPSVGATGASAASSNGVNVGASSAGLSTAGTALAGIGGALLLNKSGGGGLGALITTGGVIAGAGALNKIININPSTGKADSVSTLPSKTDAEQKLASIPGNDATSAYVNAASVTNASTASDVAAQTNIVNDAPTRALAVSNAASSTDTPPQPTNYTGPSVVTAADGSVSPVDSMGNPIYPIVNGSYSGPQSTVAASTGGSFTTSAENNTTTIVDPVTGATVVAQITPTYTAPRTIEASDGSISPVDSTGAPIYPMVNGSYISPDAPATAADMLDVKLANTTTDVQTNPSSDLNTQISQDTNQGDVGGDA